MNGSVSVGTGLPLAIQVSDWPEASPSQAIVNSPHDVSLHNRLRIEQFKMRVSDALAFRHSDNGTNFGTLGRLTVYGLLNSELVELQRSIQDEYGNTISTITQRQVINMGTVMTSWHILAAKLHLHAFYLLDEADTVDYNTRIATLYATASSLINLTVALDSPPTNLLSYCPFSCYQAFVCAAFCILKIATNTFFQTIADTDKNSTRHLETAVTVLRKISIANNDLPARLGDVLAFLCSLPDLSVIGGQSADDLRLRQTRNRLSMSVVYDCLWIWRRHFRAEEASIGGSNGGLNGTEDKSQPFLASLLYPVRRSQLFWMLFFDFCCSLYQI